MSRLSNLVSGNTGKGTIPAPSGNVPGNNAPDLSLVSSEVAELKNTVNDLAGMMATLLNKMANSQTPIVAPDKVTQPEQVAIEPANANDPATWTAERLEATRDREKDKDHMAESLTGIMVAIRDRLWPTKKGYPRSFVNIRNQDKANMIPVILEYKDAYLSGKVATPDNAPAPVQPVSQDPAILLAWQKVAELEEKGYSKEQVANLLSVFNLPNVLSPGATPAPGKVETLATVHPPANRNRKQSSENWDYQTAHENTMNLRAKLVPMYKALANEYQAIDKKFGKNASKAKLHKQVARENFKARVAEVTNAPTCGCKYGPATTCQYAKQHNLYTTGSNGRQYNLVYGDSSEYFAK